MTRLEIVRANEYKNEREFLNYLEQLVDSGGQIVGFACQPVVTLPTDPQPDTDPAHVHISSAYHAMVQYSR